MTVHLARKASTVYVFCDENDAIHWQKQVATETDFETYYKQVRIPKTSHDEARNEILNAELGEKVQIKVNSNLFILIWYKILMYKFIKYRA